MNNRSQRRYTTQPKQLNLKLNSAAFCYLVSNFSDLGLLFFRILKKQKTNQQGTSSRKRWNLLQETRMKISNQQTWISFYKVNIILIWRQLFIFLHKILQNKCQEFPEKPGWVSKTGEFHDRPRRYKLI